MEKELSGLNKHSSRGRLYSSPETLEGLYSSCSLTTMFQCLPVQGSHRSNTLAFLSGTPGVVTAAQGNGLNHVALVAHVAYSYGSHENITNRVTGCLPPPEQSPESELKHTPSFCQRGLFAYLGTLV